MQSLLTRKARGRPANEPATILSGLSDCEREVFRLVGMGLATREIAIKLDRSIKTVEAHRANLKKKLGLRNAPELNRVAANWTDRENV